MLFLTLTGDSRPDRRWSMHRIKVLSNFVHFFDCFFDRKGCGLGFRSLSAWDEGLFVFLQELALSNSALEHLSLIACLISLED